MNNVNISLGTFNNISKSLVPEVTNSFDNSNI